jgi:hypothetical protein
VVHVSLSLGLQYVVIAFLVALSLLHTFRKLAPQLTTRWQAVASAWLVQPQRARAAQALGRWLRPDQATGNCVDGCGTCGGCGTSRPSSSGSLEPQPLEFRPQQKRNTSATLP